MKNNTLYYTVLLELSETKDQQLHVFNTQEEAEFFACKSHNNIDTCETILRETDPFLLTHVSVLYSEVKDIIYHT